MGVLDSYAINYSSLDGLPSSALTVAGHGANYLSETETEKTIILSSLSVDVNKSILCMFATKCMSSAKAHLVGGKITATNQIYVKRNTTESKTVWFYFSLLEFTNVKSKQVGEYAFSNQNQITISISSVNVNKAFAFCSLYTNNPYYFYKANITWTLSSNQLQINFPISYTASGVIYWQIIEFN